jgi:acyl transferase domain-containing protein
MTGLAVKTMNPSQRKLLEVTYEAFKSAGETWNNVSGTRTGVRDWNNPRHYAFTEAGTSIFAIESVISPIPMVRGKAEHGHSMRQDQPTAPSLTVDMACSSSIHASYLAINAIRTGDCHAAVVALVDWIADLSVPIVLYKLKAFSVSGRFCTLYSRAEVYACGEGYDPIYQKRASLTTPNPTLSA